MNRREMEEKIANLATEVCNLKTKMGMVNNVLQNLFGSFYYSESRTLEEIKKSILLLAETLGYEFKPESTKKEPAKFVKKETKKNK